MIRPAFSMFSHPFPDDLPEGPERFGWPFPVLPPAFRSSINSSLGKSGLAPTPPLRCSRPSRLGPPGARPHPLSSDPASRAERFPNREIHRRFTRKAAEREISLESLLDGHGIFFGRPKKEKPAEKDARSPAQRQEMLTEGKTKTKEGPRPRPTKSHSQGRIPDLDSSL